MNTQTTGIHGQIVPRTKPEMKTVKYTITKGLPGSGKTTWAKEQVKVGHTVRVNRDDIRKMLVPNYQFGNWKMEDLVTRICDSAVFEALNAGMNVIQDDTFMSDRALNGAKALAGNLQNGLLKINFEVKDFTNIPVQTCIDRDINRHDMVRVGEGVIRRMAMRNRIHPATSNKVVIVDFDGTIADIEARRKLSVMPDGKLNYGKFFDPELIANDIPRIDIMVEIEALSVQEGADILIVSGRCEGSDKYDRYDTYNESRTWLQRHGFDYPMLNRKFADSRDDVLVKEEFLKDIRMQWDTIVCCYDDRKKVREMWERNGLKVRNCAGADDGAF